MILLTPLFFKSRDQLSMADLKGDPMGGIALEVSTWWGTFIIVVDTALYTMSDEKGTWVAGSRAMD